MVHRAGGTAATDQAVLPVHPAAMAQVGHRGLRAAARLIDHPDPPAVTDPADHRALRAVVAGHVVRPGRPVVMDPVGRQEAGTAVTDPAVHPVHPAAMAQVAAADLPGHQAVTVAVEAADHLAVLLFRQHSHQHLPLHQQLTLHQPPRERTVVRQFWLSKSLPMQTSILPARR